VTNAELNRQNRTDKIDGIFLFAGMSCSAGPAFFPTDIAEEGLHRITLLPLLYKSRPESKVLNSFFSGFPPSVEMNGAF
jgi:hypothetical protein